MRMSSFTSKCSIVWLPVEVKVEAVTCGGVRLTPGAVDSPGPDEEGPASLDAAAEEWQGGDNSTVCEEGGGVCTGLIGSRRAFKMAIATLGSIVLISSSDTVSKEVFTDRSQRTSSRDHLPLLLVEAVELRECAGVVGT